MEAQTRQIPKVRSGGGRHRAPAPRRSPGKVLSGLALGAAFAFVATLALVPGETVELVPSAAAPPAPVPAWLDQPSLSVPPPAPPLPGEKDAQPPSTTPVTPAPASSAPRPPSRPAPPSAPAPRTPAPAPTPDKKPSGTGSGTTAAERYGWGTPIAAGSDEFNGSKVDTSKWSQPDGCWDGHAGNGRRCGKNNVVSGGVLTQVGEANGDTGWLSSRHETQYGRWEARVRSEGGQGDRSYNTLLIIWPTSDEHVRDGEYDWLENGDPGASCAEAYLHYPGETPKKQEHAERCGVDFTQWQNVAFEWDRECLRGYLNGARWYELCGADIAGMPRGALAIQLDNFYGGDMKPAKFQVDWVRAFKS